MVFGGGVCTDGREAAETEGKVAVSVAALAVLFTGAESAADRLSRRTLPDWLSVRTGSASAISWSMFFNGAGGVAGTDLVALPGPRKMTPCMAGIVRVLRSTEGFAGVTGSNFLSAESRGCGAIGCGVVGIAGGWAAAGLGSTVAGAGAGVSEVGAAGESATVCVFLALGKKMSGHGMVVGSDEGFHGM